MSGAYGSVPTATIVVAATNVQVVAPATLNEGQTFNAVYEGVTFAVVVPGGGVVKGQRFIVPFNPPADAKVAKSSGAGPYSPFNDHAPTGRWRDRLCDCMNHGLCHPHFINALFCKEILMSQVLTRMKMTFFGVRADGEEWKFTFRNVVILVVVFYGVMGLTTTSPTFTTTTIDADDDGSLNDGRHIHKIEVHEDPLSAIDSFRYRVNRNVSIIFFVWTVVVLTRLRRAVRERYAIPEERCSGCEDVCCSFWCTMCTVAQVARHTSDYDEEQAMFCNDTGVAHGHSHGAEIVV